MSIWFFINLAVLLLAIWKVSTGYFSLHIFFGALGLCFVLYNWTRHAVFSTIRSDISRQRKIKYATLSKKVLSLHKYTGSLALLLIIIHAGLVYHYFGLNLSSWKVLSGLVAGITLVAVVLFGWLRWYRTTVKRRYIHLILAFCLFGFVLLHLAL